VEQWSLGAFAPRRAEGRSNGAPFRIKGTYCQSPHVLRGQTDKNGEAQQVRCMSCDGCQRYKQIAWIILATAEAEEMRAAGAASWFITFTYRPGEPGENYLRYDDVQRALKRLRAAGHACRYLVVGELGERKGRPHWHALIFWDGDGPPLPEALPGQHGKRENDKRRDWGRFWPHGHVQVTPQASADAVRYMVKYIQKGGPTGARLKTSKRPAIGQQYLDARAQRQGAQGAPDLRNWFVFRMGDGSAVEGPLPQGRWMRYREQAQQAYIDAGRGAYVPHPAYEPVMARAERRAAEMERIAQDFAVNRAENRTKPQALQVIRRKGRQRLAVYKRGRQWFARLERDRPLPWLTGVIHGADGRIREAARKPRAGRRLIEDIPITEAQAAMMRGRRKPAPETDCNAASDWLTHEAASERRRRGLKSCAELFAVTEGQEKRKAARDALAGGE